MSYGGDMSGSGYYQAQKSSESAKQATKAALMAAAMQERQQLQTREDLMPWLQAGQGAVSGLWDFLQKEYDLTPKQTVMTKEEYLDTLPSTQRRVLEIRMLRTPFEKLVPESQRMKTSHEWGGGDFGPGVEDYEKSPYYNFLLEEGVNARERGASAKGMLGSGAEAKALTKFGKDVASLDYDTWLKNWYQSLTPLQSMAGLGLTSGQTLGATGVQSALNQGNFLQSAGNMQAAGTLGQGNTGGNMIGSIGGLVNSLLGGGGGGGGIGNLFNLTGNQAGRDLGMGAGVWANPTQSYGGYYPSEMNSMTWL